MTNENEHFFHVLDSLFCEVLVPRALPIVLLGCPISFSLQFYIFKNEYMVKKINKLQTRLLYFFLGMFYVHMCPPLSFFIPIHTPFYTTDLIYLDDHPHT